MVILALYKRRKGWFNNSIYYWQLLRNPKYAKYTHTELIVDGIWYTSSYRTGIRKRKIQGDPEHWDFVHLDADIIQKKMITGWFENRMKHGYDWYGIFLSQILPLDIGHPKKWFCSESSYAALVHSRIIKRDKHAQWYSPARLSKYINHLVIS